MSPSTKVRLIPISGLSANGQKLIIRGLETTRFPRSMTKSQSGSGSPQMSLLNTFELNSISTLSENAQNGLASQRPGNGRNTNGAWPKFNQAGGGLNPYAHQTAAQPHYQFVWKCVDTGRSRNCENSAECDRKLPRVGRTLTSCSHTISSI